MNKEDEEIWRDIPGYPDYQASSLGGVRSFKTGKYVIKRQRLNTSGYLITKTYVCGKEMCPSVHTLVALAFHYEEHFNGLEVDHIDGNRTNNNESNLEWVPHDVNVDRSYRIGLQKSNVSVYIVDIVNGTKYYFTSMLAGSKFLHTGEDTFKALIKRSKINPIDNRYIINITDNKRAMNPVVTNTKNVYIYDHVSRKVSSYNSIRATIIATGMYVNQIEKAFKSGFDIWYVGGYTFAKDKLLLSRLNNVVSVNKAKRDREQELSKPYIRSKRPLGKLEGNVK